MVAGTHLNPEEIFELAKLYYERCEFKIALPRFIEAARVYLEQRDFNNYLKCLSYQLRIYAEQEDQEKINLTKDNMQDLVLKENLALNAATYHSLGVCAAYKNQLDVALDYHQKSLTCALTEDNKADICRAIDSISRTYYSMDRLQDALKEIYNLQVFFQVLPQPEIELACKLRNAHIFRKMKNFEQAIELLWQCYDILRSQRNIFIQVSLLYGMALTYRDMGELNLSRVYAKMASKLASPDDLRYTSRHISNLLQELGVTNENDFDLIYDEEKNLVVEKKRGKIDFRNQFILLDMLRLFMKEPGTVISKESLVERVWKQNYDPAVHDNKIYVTIKRLRRLIEPDFDKPKYIFRAKNGYYLNRNTKILVEGKGQH